MTEQRNAPMPDDLDALLARYLRWRSASAPGLPTASEMAIRVAGTTSSRRRAFQWRLVWAVAAVAVALASVLVFGAGVGPRSPLGLASPSAPVIGTPAPQASPISTSPIDETACTSGRITFHTGSDRTPPAASRALQAPSGGRIAIAYEDSTTTGSLVVADSRPGSARVVGDFTGEEIQDVNGVRVLGWSSTGDRLLLLASQSSSAVPPTGGTCDNLYLITADGTSGISVTDNGPGQTVAAAALSPSGSRVAYAQGADLHVFDADGGTNVDIPLTRCPFAPSQLDWAADATRVAFVCGPFVAIADISRRTVDYTAFDANGRIPMTLTWTGNETLALALEDDGLGIGSGPVLILDLSLQSGTLTWQVRMASRYQTEWVLGLPYFSPDGAYLLVQGDGAVASAFFPTYVIDTHFGKTTKLPWPVLGQSGPLVAPPVWSGGLRPHLFLADAGQLVELDLLAKTRTTIGSVPASDAVVFFPG